MSILLTLGVIGILGFACQWLAWRTKQPAILYLLIVGIAAGPIFGVLNTDELFGELLFPFVSLAVAVILFEGSLTLKRRELSDMGATVWNMVTYGALINSVIITLAAHYLVGLSWELSALFGAIMVVTGPTVIVPILRAVRPNVKISRVLRWEGIIIDPLGALFAVLVFEWIVVTQTNGNFSQIAVVFLQTIIIGSLIGAAFAYVFGLLLRNHWIPEYLHNFAAISFVGGAFALSDTLMHESGLLAVTIMGIWLANMRGVHVRSILEFKETLTLIFVSVLFILLAARINLNTLVELGWGAVGVLAVMMLIARPIKTWLSTIGSTFTTREKLMLSWLGPRGIVAAAISALFALRLEQLGFEKAELLVPLSFSLIIGTVVIQSLTAKPIATWLGVRQPDATGYIVIGANPVAIFMGKALKEAGAEVCLCDNDWQNIRDARMSKLTTYYGNPISDHAELYLDTSPYGGMLGMSHHEEKNVAAALRFKEEFDIRRIFTLPSSEESKETDKHRTSNIHKGRVLFDEDTNYGKLILRLNEGHELSKTTISESFTFEDWKTHYPKDSTIALFATTEKKEIIWFTNDSQVKPQAKWTIYSLSNKIEKKIEQAQNRANNTEELVERNV